MDTSNFFITSDLHFHHRNLLEKYEKWRKNEFASLDDMDEYILEQFDCLPPNCTIINNGDLFVNSSFSYPRLQQYVYRMKGEGRKLWIILGNHDRHAYDYCKNCVYDNAYDMYKGLGFDKVFEDPILIKEKFILSHEPIFLTKDNNLINLYGHTHSKDVEENYFSDTTTEKINPGNYFNVCWDKHHQIIKLDDILNNFNRS